MVFFSYKIKKMIAFKWMVERKQEPPWGGIKQLNFPLLSASPTTSLNGKGHRTLQQNIYETRCTTALGHDMLPGHPVKALLSLTWRERQMGQQMADQNRGRGSTSREEGGDGAAAERGVPWSNKNETACRAGGVWARRGGSGHLDWVLLERQPLSNAQLRFTINATINRQCFYAAPSALHIGSHLILHAALGKVASLAPFQRWGKWGRERLHKLARGHTASKQ